MHISIGAEHLFDIAGFPVYNTMLTSWFVVIFLVCLSLFINKRVKKNPNGHLALAIEAILDGFINFMSAFAGDRKTVKKFIPIIGAIFFYVLTSNWAGTLPGVETIGIEEHAEKVEIVETMATGDVPEHSTEENTVLNSHIKEGPSAHTEVSESHGEDEHRLIPLFRTVNSDLNMTFMLALIIIIGSHIVGFKTIGAKHHLGKFFINPLKNPIGAFVGILEVIGEISKTVSLTFRLFGNIFAGSVLMLIISFLAPFIVPLPFLGLELFVGFIQALVISVLATMFLSSATHKHDEH